MTGACWLRPAAALAAWLIVSAATPHDESLRLYESGKYLDSASLAATADTASSIALAARATLAHAIYVADPAQRAAGVQRGEELAGKALSIDPDHVEAHLALVIALHQKTLATTPIGAYFRGYATEARSHLKTVLRLDPDNPGAHLLLGGWHFEIVRLAGPAVAVILFEAELTDGRAAFAKAIALMPGSIVPRYEFARALLLNDADTNRTEAAHLLRAALQATPTDYLDKMIATRAGALLDAMKSGSSVTLSRALH
ncbi:MAG: hypothetical protein QF511_12655 [Rhodospirillales bacterium]|jgi:tetratricopeptide (TPR) repeat protein|nr:hypothetical protein [Rhodospirillales bacterium]HIJ43960.1 hypothetical protein [Rhodospirillaceae bacterium]MDP7099333.1 hypothetical protein [Rhodospirillales bacterium]MDP7215081.1 hypothetical protein [Rhodospirillales bacterium]HIJ93587.1 hypothetical protein [Rhodospirillaceae bacterium]